MRTLLVATLMLSLSMSFAARAEDARDACLTQLTAQIAKAPGSLLVRPSKAAFNSSIDKISQQVPLATSQPASVEYGESFPTGSNSSTSLEKRTRYRQGDTVRDVTIDISQERNISSFYKLAIDEEVIHLKDQQMVQIYQQFDINSRCQWRLFNTTVSTKKIKGSQLTMISQSFSGAHPTKGGDVSKIQKDLPQDGPTLLYINTDHTMDAPAFFFSWGSKGYMVSDSVEIPFFPISIRPASEDYVNPFLQTTVHVSGVEVSAVIEGSSFVIGALSSRDKKETVSISPDSQMWLVSQADWLRGSIIALTHSGELPVTTSDGVDPDAEIGTVVMTSVGDVNQLTDLGMYWKVLDSRPTVDGVNGSFVSEMKASSPLKYADFPSSPPLDPHSSGRAFLSESQYVKPWLPEVQQLAKEALQISGNSKNRLVLAQAIGAVLRKHIYYNMDSIEVGGQVREEDTADILKNKNGTCQNFSNVFAAVARSLGIPTRIIAGISISTDAANYHAWVEVEAVDGIWIPFEPQQATDRMFTGGYLPLAVEQLDTYYDEQVQGLLSVPTAIEIMTTRYW